ncbi:hypothetical protein [Mucilaginibacter flavus]|uniref:hypothetical protein n=1 Tax=Mucilaginibacter flavus TaxID=931504 RepID=UPI0025B38053|nr:hypothetical protein [Mucilaginibacter flavus]MDN3583252.1 hypothetical protein [Mucilaginibacter flavus]
MKNHFYHQIKACAFKIFITCLLAFVITGAFAQDKTKTIGNKSREGSTNTSFDAVKGAQVGIRMNAGHKKVELLKLTFHCKNRASDSIAFKVNVYHMGGKLPIDSNLVKEQITGFIGKYNKSEIQEVSVDLSAYHVLVSGDILVSIEFLTTKTGSNISFACGLLNGGTFHKDGITQPWKKIPVVGVDFNVLVKKLK